MNLAPRCANCGKAIRVFQVFCATCQPNDKRGCGHTNEWQSCTLGPECDARQITFYERWEAAR